MRQELGADLKYKTILCEACSSTFRTIGDTGTSQNFFTLENGAASGIVVEVTRLLVIHDLTVSLTRGHKLRVSRPITLPSGGTTLTTKLRDTLAATNALVVARGATASDGGAATKITAVAEAPLFSVNRGCAQTLVGQIVPYEADLCPVWPIVINAGESILVDFFAGATGFNPSTSHYLVRCSWREYIPL